MRGCWRCLRITARGVFCAACLLLTSVVLLVFPAQAEPPPGDALPILMYHSVLKDPARAGAYVVSPAVVEEDFCWLRDRGCAALTISEAAGLAARGEPLPENAVAITFDDGFLNVSTYVLPLLERYDLKATVAVIGSGSERFSDTPDPNPAYASLDWGEIARLAASGRVEIAVHSYDLHRLSPRKGAGRRAGESEAEYRAAFRADTEACLDLLREHCGIVPTTYAYPYGEIDESSFEVLSQLGFTAALTCRERVNHVLPTGGALLVLDRFNRPSGVSTANFMKKLGIYP